jgi:hypothetical protein
MGTRKSLSAACEVSEAAAKIIVNRFRSIGVGVTTMNQNITRAIIFSLLTASLALCGCIVSVGGSRNPTPPPESPPSMSPVIITNAADLATAAEIDAAAQLSIESNRAYALTQLAERPALSPPLQVHLINITYRRLTMDNNRTHVLTRIVARPDFNDATRQAIVSQLRLLSMDANRQYILQQVNRRMIAKPGTENTSR